MLDADLLLDRARLKRRLTGWRIAAVVAGVVAVGVVAAPLAGRSPVTGRHIARVNITGIITEDRKLLDAVLALAKDRSVPAVIVSIDSPGGAVSGGESIRAALIRVAAAKPVVAVMRGTAASAGYMVALPAARIFARDATVTGSIGVILQTIELSGLLAKVGVTAEAITSGPLKDQPSQFKPLNQPGRDYLTALTGDLFDQFVGMVADARHMDPAQVRVLADGRAYTGRQAIKLGLVDEIGGEIEARDWLKRERGISDSIPATDLKLGSFYERAMTASFGGVWQSLLGASLAPSGPWAIWQAGLQ